MHHKTKYKITNTTIKAPRINPRTGLDMRSAGERIGHGVSYITDDGKKVIVQVNRPSIVDHLNEGMIRLKRGKFVEIEEIDDVSSVLKKHTLNAQRDILTPSEHVKVEDVSHPAADRAARVVEMGLDDHSQKSGKEIEGAINPDGEPNFFVKADKNMKRKTKASDVKEEGETPTA